MPISPLGLLDRVLQGRAPLAITAAPILPLQGLTILAVEDSRFTSDALRLMCQRSGARLRRVDRMQAAYSHLRVYRPDVMLVDMGLPDGRGDTLIRDLTQYQTHGPVVIAISGDPSTRDQAMFAGAQSFIEKPFVGLAAFQDAILRHLPDQTERCTSNSPHQDLMPDPLALQDDLVHAANLISCNPDTAQRHYVAGFVTELARSSNDAALAAAARALTDPREGMDRLHRLLATRISAGKAAFDGVPR